MIVAILTVRRCSEYIIVIIIISNLMETCRLLITFANSLDSDQDQQNVGSDLDPNCLCRTHFLKKLILKKKSADDKENMKNYPACKELNISQVLTKERFFEKVCQNVHRFISILLPFRQPKFMKHNFLHATVE